MLSEEGEWIVIQVDLFLRWAGVLQVQQRSLVVRGDLCKRQGICVDHPTASFAVGENGGFIVL